MSYKCEECEQTTSAGDIFNTLFKVALIGGLAYLAINFKSEIKEAVQNVIKKTGGTVSGISDSSSARKRKPRNKKSKKLIPTLSRSAA